MNQFAQLLSREKQTSLVLDSCTVIGARNGSQQVLQFRKKIAKRKDIRVIVPSIVVSEVQKVAHLSFEEATKLVESFSEHGQIDYVSCEDKELVAEAEALRAKYPIYSHYPDDHYLVIARRYGAVLITYDRKLKDVARTEGVMTCAPGSFRMYQ